MRIISIALLAFTAVLAPAQQPAASNLVPSGKLSIPAQLSKTVRADKAHPGDLVEFKTLEAVLVGKDVVMPANTLLHGRVLSAGPKQEGKNSWLALVVERAEWKQHSLPLHAFIAAQITLSTNNQRNADPGNVWKSPSSPQRAGRQSARLGVGSDPTLSNVIKAPQDATPGDQDQVPVKAPSLENVDIFRDKGGTTYLLSSKANVKLPAGLMVMLKNEPAGSSETTDAQTATSAPSAQPQP